MSKPDYPRFADTVENNTSLVQEPSSGKKDVGWVQEMPPFQIFNWLLVKIYRWIKWIESKLQRPEPWLLRSDATLAWNGASITFTQPIELHFRNTAGALYINRIAVAGSPIVLSDGQVVVARLDRANASPVSLTLQATYASLAVGQYSIVAQASLTLTNEEDEVILFRRSGSNLEIPMHGLIYPTGATVTLGQAFPLAHNHSSASTGGQLDWDEVWSDAVHSHLSAGEGGTLDAAAIASGTFADARVSQSSVTQHQAALTILETQITDGTLLARLAANETVAGAWTFPSSDPPAANTTTSLGLGKVYARVNGIGSLNDSYNVTSASRLSDPGQYQVIFDTDFASGSYFTIGQIYPPRGFFDLQNPLSTSLTCANFDTGDTLANLGFQVACFGLQ